MQFEDRVQNYHYEYEKFLEDVEGLQKKLDANEKEPMAK